jgi:hypothetical protein
MSKLPRMTIDSMNPGRTRVHSKVPAALAAERAEGANLVSVTDPLPP